MNTEQQIEIDGYWYVVDKNINTGDRIVAVYTIDKGGELEMKFKKDGIVVDLDQDFRVDDYFKIKNNHGFEFCLKSEAFKVIQTNNPEIIKL